MFHSRIFSVTVIQTCQCRSYGKVQISQKLLSRIRKAQKPTTSSFDEKHLSIDKDEQNDLTKIQRKIWARRGNKSGIDVNEIIPSRQEIFNEAKRENEWWPSLQQLQSEINEINRLKQEASDEKMRKIKKNMAMMPKWIEEYKANLNKEKIEAEKARIQKQRDVEKIKEHFGYDIDQTHPKFKEYLENMKLEEKEALKKQRREKKKQAKLRASTTSVF